MKHVGVIGNHIY